MPKHKAPTQVTIATTQDQTGLNLWLDKYWKLCAGLLVVVVAWILYQSHTKSAKREMGQLGWSKLLAVISQDPSTGVLSGAPEDLKRVGGELEGTPEGAWAIYLAATSAAARKEFDTAIQLLTELKNKYPNSTAVNFHLTPNSGEEPRSLVDQLQARIEAQRDFIRDHSGLFENPALPADAPRVRLTTERGAIVVGLYSDAVPKTVENFLKLVRDGSYNGTNFHVVVNGQYIRGGDPNTIAGDPKTWGNGGPGYALDKEASTLRNFAGVISATPDLQDSTKMSGSQFLITTTDAHNLDEGYLPFGKVLEGLDVAREIERSPVAENTYSQPANPTKLITAEVL